jgi:hypothetical protein
MHHSAAFLCFIYLFSVPLYLAAQVSEGAPRQLESTGLECLRCNCPAHNWAMNSLIPVVRRKMARPERTWPPGNPEMNRLGMVINVPHASDETRGTRISVSTSKQFICKASVSF